MKTLAAVLTQQKKPLELINLEIPKLKSHQVLVRVLSSGVCGSQIGEIDGVKGPDLFLPHCLGHEATAEVVEAGPGAGKVKSGCRVILHWKPGSGREAEPAVYRSGRLRVNAGRVTTFQQYAVVSENRLTAVSRTLDPDCGALYGCALTTAFGNVTRDAKIRPGETVWVIGAGGLGILQVRIARWAGASKIVVCDLHASKLTLAKQWGADEVIWSGSGLERRLVRSGFRPDVVFENTGKSALIQMAYRLSAANGRVILVGVPDARDPVCIDTLPLHFGKILTGSHGGQANPDRDIPYLLKLQAKNKWDFTAVTTRGYRLEEVNAAIADLRSGKAIRPVLEIGKK